ncbi:MAG: hypothetical protein ACOX68_00485 [Candidatus Limivicinus sp.]|jgi:hypothetical protein
MGYFDRLQKKARARSGAWSGWSYTGTSAGGVDYVNDTDMFVVYGTRVNYEAGETGLSEISVSTNFVSPLSSGNPSTATCFLYTTPPEGDYPPGNFVSSDSLSFSANTAGSYLSFSFSGLDIKPDYVYFWFTCSTEYAGYGSNQMYHYATGNWNPGYNTGTGTPAVYGSFIGSGSGGGGTEGGGTIDPGVTPDKFSVVDKGTETDLSQKNRSYSIDLSKKQIARIKFSFDFSARTRFSLINPMSGTELWLCNDSTPPPDVDEDTGVPLSCIYSTNGGQSFELDVESGKIYYLLGMYRGGYMPGPLEFEIIPPPVNWRLGDSAEYTLLEEEAAHHISLGPGRYSCVKLSFAHSGRAEIYTENAAVPRSYQYLEAFLCDKNNFNSTTGKVDYSVGSGQGHGGYVQGEDADPNFSFSADVTAGKTYFLFTKNAYEPLEGGDTAVSAELRIKPPAKPERDYILVDRGSIEDLSSDTNYVIYASKYTVYREKLSFRYRGRAEFTAENAPDYQGIPVLRSYISCDAGVNLTDGRPTGSCLARAESNSDKVSMSCEVEDRKTYWLFIVSSEIYRDETGGIDVHIKSPEARYFSVTDRREFYNLDAAAGHTSSPGESGVCMVEMTFAHSGRARISAEYISGQSEFLRAYVSMTPYFSGRLGEPQGEITVRASGSPDNKDCSLSFSVRGKSTYYLFCRDDWLYGSPFFKITAELSGGSGQLFIGGRPVLSQAFIYSGNDWHSAETECFLSGSWHAGT